MRILTILEDLIQPNIGVFTSFGSAHSANFESTEQHLNEKLKLFKNVEQMFYNGKIDLDLKSNFRPVFPENIKALTSNLNLDNINDISVTENNKNIPVIDGNVKRVVARFLGLKNEINSEKKKAKDNFYKKLVLKENPVIFCCCE